jgi:hypothetical protein
MAFLIMPQAGTQHHTSAATFGTEYGLSAGVYSPNVLGVSFTVSPLNWGDDAAGPPCLLPRYSQVQDLIIECCRDDRH